MPNIEFDQNLFYTALNKFQIGIVTGHFSSARNRVTSLFDIRKSVPYNILRIYLTDFYQIYYIIIDLDRFHRCRSH